MAFILLEVKAGFTRFLISFRQTVGIHGLIEYRLVIRKIVKVLDRNALDKFKVPQHDNRFGEIKGTDVLSIRIVVIHVLKQIRDVFPAQQRLAGH